MAKYKTDQIRNIAIVGHGGTGKTMLAEAMLFKTGALNRMGKISEGNTVSDFTTEEKAASHSMHLALMNVERKEKHINISDCPGYADFIGGAYQGMAVCDTALICVTGTDGIQVQTRKMWELSNGKARVVAVTRLDAPQASFSKVVDQVRSVFGKACTPIAFPTGDDGGEGFNGVVSLLTGENLTDEMKEARQTLIENAISSNEDLMMLYLEDQPIPPEDLNKAIANAILTGELVPIVPVAAEKDALGVDALLDVIADLCPSPADVQKPIVRGLETVMVKADPSAEFLAQVFRVRSDPHLRRLTFFRVYSGTFNAGDSLKSQTSSRGERIQQLLQFQGGKHTEVKTCIAGDILATAKVESFALSDTLTVNDGQGLFSVIKLPVPMVKLAIEPKSSKDAAKCSEKLRDLESEDPTFLGRYDPATKELVISGLGQLHLEAKLSLLKSLGVEVGTRQPKIPYKETIAGTADVLYRHKKQSGGSGQFGQVSIRVEPNTRGAGFEFIDDIVGGVIPGSLIPSVEKGIRKKLETGIIAGYEVVDIKCSLYDGKTHPVDSKDIAFQIAGREAIKKAVQDAKPILLEPIVNLEVTVPNAITGDITGLVAGKRGLPSGMDSLGDLSVVKAQVPLAELQNFSSELKSISGGAGSYSIEFSHYAPVPGNVQQDIIKNAQMKEDED